MVHIRLVLLGSKHCTRSKMQGASGTKSGRVIVCKATMTVVTEGQALTGETLTSLN